MKNKKRGNDLMASRAATNTFDFGFCCFRWDNWTDIYICPPPKLFCGWPTSCGGPSGSNNLSHGLLLKKEKDHFSDDLLQVIFRVACKAYLSACKSLEGEGLEGLFMG